MNNASLHPILIDFLGRTERLSSKFAHDARGALNRVDGYGQLLLSEREGILSPKQKEYAQQIHRGAEELLALVTQLQEDIRSLKTQGA